MLDDQIDDLRQVSEDGDNNVMATVNKLIEDISDSINREKKIREEIERANIETIKSFVTKIRSKVEKQRR